MVGFGLLPDRPQRLNCLFLKSVQVFKRLDLFHGFLSVACFFPVDYKLSQITSSCFSPSYTRPIACLTSADNGYPKATTCGWMPTSSTLRTNSRRECIR